MKIYTKTGDKGTTRLVDGLCVDKSDPRVESYGTVDELNSFVGLLRSELKLSSDLQSELTSTVDNELSQIQHQLFNIGSLLATKNIDILKKLKQVHEVDIGVLEKAIDRMTDQLPELKNFILPTGHKLSSLSHVCRTVCRRAERQVSLFKNDEAYFNTIIYLNRLSDYFFTLARFINLKAKVEDVLWKSET